MVNEFIEGILEAFGLLFSFDLEVWGIILLSLRVSGTAIFVATLMSLPIGSFIALRKFRGKKPSILYEFKEFYEDCLQIKKRRNNQRFASRENQIRYNNIKAQEKRNIKSQVDRVLDKNRTNLHKLLDGKTEITKSHDFLLGAGFGFGYFSFYRLEFNTKSSAG